MKGTVQPGAFAVNMGLHVFVLRFTVVILKREDRAWDAVICETGERRVGAIVHDVEATNAMVVIVMSKELGKVAILVSCSYAECYVFVRVHGRRCGFVTEGI